MVKLVAEVRHSFSQYKQFVLESTKLFFDYNQINIAISAGRGWYVVIDFLRQTKLTERLSYL